MIKVIKTASFVCAVIAFAVSSSLSASESKDVIDSKQIATKWFDSLTIGDVEATMKVSAVPFALDGKELIKTTDELEEIYKSIVENKGKRNVKSSVVQVTEGSGEVLNGLAVVKYFIVKLDVEGEGISVYVLPGETFKVMGFRD